MTDEEMANNNCHTSSEAIEAYIVERKRRVEAREQAKAQERIRKEKESREHGQRLAKVRDAFTYSDEFAKEICERLASGELLTVICLDEHMPSVRRCNQWLHENSDFKILFDQSLQDRLNIFEEQLIEFPDSAALAYIEVKKGNTVQRMQDTGKVQAAKLQVEVRRLHLKAGRPAKWGDSATIITKDASDNFDAMTPEELERQIAEIEKKSRVVRAA